MGILDWFRREPTNVEVMADRIWLTKAAKLAGISAAVGESLADWKPPDAVLLVAHFAECHDELQKVVESGRFSPDRVMVTTAAALTERSAAGLPLGEEENVLMIVGERHPLASRDDGLVEFARTLSCRCRMVFHLSLEDALMEEFSGEWVRNTLRQLGMTEDESIESQMVARRIRQAQKKIERRVRGDAPAASARDWLQQNCPG